MIQRLLILITLLFASLQCKSQSSFFTSNYYINQMLINPAKTGLDHSYELVTAYNNQWLGINNSPSTYFIAGQIRVGSFEFYNPKEFLNKSKFKSLNRVGLGGSVYYDKDGPLSQFMAKLSYAYHVPLINDAELSFGISSYLSQSSLNLSEFQPRDINDPYIQEECEKQINVNFDLGVLYSHSRYFIGLSFRKIIPVKEDESYIFQDTPDIYLLGGYLFGRENNVFAYKPTIVLKSTYYSDGIIIDVHNKFYLAKVNWIAVSFKDKNQLCFSFAIKATNLFHIGYSYNYTMSQISDFNFGTHGIMFGMNLGI